MDSVIGGDSLSRRGPGSVTLVRRGAEEDANAKGDAAADAMRRADAADVSSMRVRVRSCPASNAGPVHFLIPLDNHERCGLIDDNGNIYLGDEVDRAQHL